MRTTEVHPPFLSVVIPNYNHARFLNQRIDSVLQQTYQDFELIILDDKSSDNSHEIIEKFREHPKVRHIIYNETNSGSPFKQWQKGIRLASGEYIWIAESDDYADESFLQEMLHLIETNENIGVAFCNSYWIDDQGAEGKSLSLYDTSFIRMGKDEMTALLRHNTIQNASSVIMKTELAKKYASSITAFRACGDWMLYVNILSESDVAYTSKRLNHFRWYHNNVSNAANKNGVWLSEGMRIIRTSKAYTLRLSPGKIRVLYRYWKTRQKSSGIKSGSSLNIAFFVFFIKSTFMRLKPGANG